MLYSDAGWAEIEALRERVTGFEAATVLAASEHFATLFAETFESSVLVRVFLVQPYEALPEMDSAFVRTLVGGDGRLRPKTLVLSLLGTRGRDPAWNDRRQSRGHLAIPLLDREFVQSAPMIAKLLADLEVDLAGLDDGRPIATRRLLGGNNGTFYVRDAQDALDERGRSIIADQEFARQHDVHTVFGMGGMYFDGTLAIAIVFSNETLERVVIDRYPSFISTFKIATGALLTAGRIYE